jgi:CRP/FNR family transcriptional regulator, cyclic AMP receptor protein
MLERRGSQPLPLDDVAPGDPARRPSASAESARRDPSIGAAGTRRRFDRGETALAQGSTFRGIFVVEAGLFQESAVSDDGRWFIHGLIGPGDVFGCFAANLGARTTVRAVTRSEATAVASEELADLLARRSEAAWSMLCRMEARARRGQAVAEELAWLDVGARIRRRLADLALEHGRPVDDGVRIDATITQEELGAMIGATRETVNRALVALIAAGDVRVDRRRWVVRRSVLHAQAFAAGA